jgi:[ribosomal protein S18]-alanine N-acetyltransferase
LKVNNIMNSLPQSLAYLSENYIFIIYIFQFFAANDMEVNAGHNLAIKKLETFSEAEKCALITSQSEPWKFLKITYEDSLKTLTNDAYETYILYDEDNICGFVTIDMCGALAGYIKRLAIRKDLQNRSYGRMLMNFAERRIFTEKPNVFLCVSSFNKKAILFYKKLGYKQAGVLKNFLIMGHSEYLLRKTIAPLLDFEKE